MQGCAAHRPPRAMHGALQIGYPWAESIGGAVAGIVTAQTCVMYARRESMASTTNTPASIELDLFPPDVAWFPHSVPVNAIAWQHLDLATVQYGELPAEVRNPSLYRARMVAQRVNERRDWSRVGFPALQAGQIMSAGLLLDILRYVTYRYALDQEPGILGRALDELRRGYGPEAVDRPCAAYTTIFPPQASVRDGVPVEEVLAQTLAPTDLPKLPRREEAVWDILLVWLANQNPAMRSMKELIDDSALEEQVRYKQFTGRMDAWLAKAPPVAELDSTLVEALRAPMLASPDSLDGQLEYILRNWVRLLPKWLVERLLVTRAILREEIVMRGHGPGGQVALTFDQGHGGLDYPEPERFTKDADWMSNVVLIAKTAFVWLDQLSKRYQREIRTLDQIPDEELDKLARWGFTGLWLIGLWERSVASSDIKRRMGNPEAAASAYSLYDYQIAHELGGEGAYESLRERAARRGIRLASDMVPNHVGIYSKWVVEHPDWFVQLPYPPFPGYTFNGPNLSPDGRVVIQIEDGYWERRDAAVVFRRIDTHTGDTRYIYHGNDGTSMPWNDTAQLDYLNAAVREAVIQTILHVARQFPIIRFDAAMTLAKRHYQRLWFPKPGEGGAIPSRAEFGMTKEEFDAVMPEEFWREVVDRVQAECPDTLLLAEAFWLMEGYFVRTLGMHRVYNSAFMNMLKMEDNEKYRQTIQNVLEFSPEVLQRFVNFMSNPDEMTAIEQFGNGDKYYGCAVLMVTNPGLPMFAHGQIEGLTEKYGMEYRRAYWDEQVDDGMVWRHEREIFPLMRRRYLFSGAKHFALYDVHTPHGHIDNNVFAYTNRYGHEVALIVYNNAYSHTRGVIHTSTRSNHGTADSPHFVTVSLGEALGLSDNPSCYYLFRDYRDGLQYIRQGAQLCHEGMVVDLHGYQYHAFLDWELQVDADGSWGALEHHLAGRGVPDIRLEQRRLMLSPVLSAFGEFLNAITLKRLVLEHEEHPERRGLADDIEESLREFLETVEQYTTVAFSADGIVEALDNNLALLWDFRAFAKKAGLPKPAVAYLFDRFESPAPSAPAASRVAEAPPTSAAEPPQDEEAVLDAPEAAEPSAEEHPPADPVWLVPMSWTLMRSVAEAFTGADNADTNPSWMDDWLLTPHLIRALEECGQEHHQAVRKAQLVSLLLHHADGQGTGGPLSLRLRALTEHAAVRAALGVNDHEGVWYVNKEAAEAFFYWMAYTESLLLAADATHTPADWAALAASHAKDAAAIASAMEENGYRLHDALLALETAADKSGNTSDSVGAAVGTGSQAKKVGGKAASPTKGRSTTPRKDTGKDTDD